MPKQRTMSRTCKKCGAPFLTSHTEQVYCGRACTVASIYRKHGLYKTPEYSVWREMRSRCRDATRAQFPNYGGRGITICERWNDFAAFYADMGARPTPQHSIDRIDNDGPYSPENCRWATRSEQQRNRTDNVRLTYQGKTQTLAEWALELGVKRQTLDARRRDGLPIEKILSRERLPVGRPRRTPV